MSVDPEPPGLRARVRRRRADVPIVVWIGFAAFIGLGLPEATLGVTWPSIRGEFGEPLSRLGLLLGALTVGYLPSSALSGPIVARVGAGRMLATASAAYVAAMACYVLGPSLPVLLVGSLLGGIAAGLIDPGINAHFAVHHGTRAMNLLHASFGIGATTGPLVATLALHQGWTWRVPYIVYLVVQGALLAAFAITRDSWSARSGATGSDAGERRESSGSGTASPLVVATAAVTFFVYTGLEVGAGVLAFTLLNEGRGLDDTAAGLWATAFWLGLTVGRVLLGVAGARLTPHLIVRAGVAGAIATTALVWSDAGGLGAVGFPLLGLSLAGIFPSLVLLTPERVGTDRTAHLVGAQFSLAAIGAAAIPAGIGIIADGHLERIGAVLFALAVAVAALDAAVVRLGRQAPAGAVPPIR